VNDAACDGVFGLVGSVVVNACPTRNRVRRPDSIYVDLLDFPCFLLGNTLLRDADSVFLRHCRVLA